MIYIPGNRNLETGTLPLWAEHRGFVLEQDVHSMNAYFQCEATDKYFADELKTRSFIFSRSSFTGSHQWAGLSLGDNQSTVQDLKRSTEQIFVANSFGYLQTGADICGFNGNSDQALCTRWT
jgi:alpha-glucosidase (family GH31 glycosyl hydrolase)